MLLNVAGMLKYRRNFLFSLRNCWKSTSKTLGHGLTHRPLSKQVWLTLKNLNLLAPCGVGDILHEVEYRRVVYLINSGEDVIKNQGGSLHIVKCNLG